MEEEEEQRLLQPQTELMAALGVGEAAAEEAEAREQTSAATAATAAMVT